MPGRKRKLEQIVSDLKTESGKKQKADESLLSAKSKMASNKGNMNDSVSESELDLNMDTGGEQCLRSFMQNISKDINKSINGLNRRMNQMEDSFEQKLVDKLCTVITQTVKDEIKRVRSDFDSEICAMRTKLLELETVVKESASPGSNGSVQRRHFLQWHFKTPSKPETFQGSRSRQTQTTLAQGTPRRNSSNYTNYL